MLRYGILDLPIFDLNTVDRSECIRMAHAAEQLGAFVVLDDAHYDAKAHRDLLDVLEQFGQLPDRVQNGYIRPHFQAGWMPPNVECARGTNGWVRELRPEHRPIPCTGPNRYGRWFHRPNVLAFDGATDPELLPQNVTVTEIPNWNPVLETWGTGMMQTIVQVARWLAIGWSLPEETIVEMLRGGHNIVGATITDLRKFGRPWEVHAHRHYDLNALTGHDGSRFRVLIIWTKDDRPMLVRMPPGHRLIQVGRMLEHITGGRALRGYHQTATLPETLEDMLKAMREDRPLVRGSATFFAAIRADVVLDPLSPFRDNTTLHRYPKLLCGELIREELAAIKMRTREWQTGQQLH